jgi:iron complex outermembrane receptor protein
MNMSLSLMLTVSALAIAAPAVAQVAAPVAPAEAVVGESEDPNSTDVVVTARKRNETLKDVPVAATVVSGDVIEKRGLASVRDIATLTPGLNINGDGAGRAFVSIRGVGVTLVDSVQPGVGIFLDGIYQPNTSYLNNPLLDVERVEVLRGPQGTLYGKNTLGGAINVITKVPTNDPEFKLIGSYAAPDQSWFASGSASGAIIPDKLLARVAYGHRQQDGFIRNTLLGTDANLYNSDTVNATIRARPAGDVTLTVNGYYNWVKAGSVPYAFVTGPTDYNRDIQFNTNNYQFFKYRGINGRLQAPIASLNTDVTLIGAYDARDVKTPAQDLDFSPVDFARARGTDDIRTKTAELRFDTKYSPQLSSIVGLFYSRETRDAQSATTIVPFGLTGTQDSKVSGDTYAVFGNVFYHPADDWELSAGLRYDKQNRKVRGSVVSIFGVPTPISDNLDEEHLSPRIAITHDWSPRLMSYASISRGFRGGGFNPPAAPAELLTYKGDNVWTYELGTKYSSPLFSLSGAVFYNDYKDYIGLNSIARASSGGFTTVDLNTGDVRSYGVELEGLVHPTAAWTISGGVSLQHARITDDSIYTARTGRRLASDRLPFQPDWNFNLRSDYTVPVGSGEIVLGGALIGKGSRIAASLSETEAPVLKRYILTNASLTYKINKIEVTGFVDNLFKKDFFESYIEKTTLILAGLPPTDVGIPGEQRRIGIRTRLIF